MKHILVAGAGVIGQTVAQWLASTQDYQVYLVDKRELKRTPPAENCHVITQDIEDHAALKSLVEQHHIEAVISTLPYFCNKRLAQFAKQNHLHYFDPTEDNDVTKTVAELAQGADQVFAPQCGLAPGFVDIVAHDLIQQFESVERIKIRCGALPQDTNNALYYSFTWSPDGLINEYIHPCFALRNHKFIQIQALEGLEQIKIDGLEYEAFNTSGGLGSLAETYADKVASMDYKTIRYPGHNEKVRFLLNDLKLRDEPETLKKILLHSIPYTKQDVVLVYVSCEGMKNSEYIKQTYIKKYYPRTIHGVDCTAIQLTTSAGICAVVDMTLCNTQKYHGFIKQEIFDLSDLAANRFGSFLTQTSQTVPEGVYA